MAAEAAAGKTTIAGTPVSPGNHAGSLSGSIDSAGRDLFRTGDINK